LDTWCRTAGARIPKREGNVKAGAGTSPKWSVLLAGAAVWYNVVSKSEVRTMATEAATRPPKEEIARLGKLIYERDLRARLETEANIGKIVVIDIETGDYEMDDDHLAAVRRARAKHSGAVLFGMRIGYPTFARIGGSWGSASR
jgi:hypothetical protein